MKARPMFPSDAIALRAFFETTGAYVVRLGFDDAVDMPAKPRTATMLLDHLDGMGFRRPDEWRKLHSRKIRQIYGAAWDAGRLAIRLLVERKTS